MENLPTVEELKAERDEYNDRVRAYIEGRGGEFIDKAASAPGIGYVLEKLEEVHASTGPGTYLDMGTGFSTFVVSEWCVSRGWSYLGVDHDKPWIRFIRSLVDTKLSHLPEADRPTLMHRRLFVSETQAKKLKFEAMFIDHGPQLDTRAQDTPWLSTLVAPKGLMLFDDWRPKHEGRIRRALAKAQGRWVIGDGGDAIRRFPRDKSIGWAHREGER